MIDDDSSAPQVGDDFYRRLCERGAAALIATDDRLRVVFLNTAAADLLGVDADRIVGQPIEHAVPVQRRKLFRRLLDRTIQGGQTSQFEVRLPNGDGGISFGQLVGGA